MIHIKNAKKIDVLTTIDQELGFLTGMHDNLVMLQDVKGPAGDDMDKLILQNAVLKSIQNNMRKELGGKLDLLQAIGFATSNLSTWLTSIRKDMEKSSTKTYDDETITFKERGMLDAISSVNFFNRYTTMIVNILTSYGYDNEQMNKVLNKIDLELFNTTAAYYTSLLIKFNQPVPELIKMIDNLSEELADDLSEEILRGAEGDTVVSIRQGLAPHKLNPVHWYYLWKMHRDIEVLRSGQEQIDLLAMKIARLNNRNSGVEDPALDHQIEVYSDKITKINARKRKILEYWNE